MRILNAKAESCRIYDDDSDSEKPLWNAYHSLQERVSGELETVHAKQINEINGVR